MAGSMGLAWVSGSNAGVTGIPVGMSISGAARGSASVAAGSGTPTVWVAHSDDCELP